MENVRNGRAMNTLPQDQGVNVVTLAQVRIIQPECFPVLQPSARQDKFQLIEKTCDTDPPQQAIACLIKAAIDAAVALDELKRYGSDPDGDRIIVERVFSACEAVQS